MVSLSLPASKSVLNRALVIQSFNSGVEVEGANCGEDVADLQNALKNLGQDKYTIRNGGTSLRFLALRLSRLAGQFKIFMGAPLFSRPHADILRLLNELGVEAFLENRCLHIVSQGWQKPTQPLSLSLSTSSQYASGLVLSSWNLPFDLEYRVVEPVFSYSYWNMTKKVLNDFLPAGLAFSFEDQSVIPRGVMPKSCRYFAEPDMSSAFALAALGAITKGVVIAPLESSRLQGDGVFVEVLSQMGVPCDLAFKSLQVSPVEKLKSISMDLSSTPDLFPVLAVLCGLAEGESHLSGLGNLAHKESDRLAEVCKLWGFMGVKYKISDHSVSICGRGSFAPGDSLFVFDTVEDHRLAFAAGVLLKLGWNIKIQGKDCVNKSYPEYWRHYTRLK